MDLVRLNMPRVSAADVVVLDAFVRMGHVILIPLCAVEFSQRRDPRSVKALTEIKAPSRNGTRSRTMHCPGRGSSGTRTASGRRRRTSPRRAAHETRG